MLDVYFRMFMSKCCYIFKYMNLLWYNELKYKLIEDYRIALLRLKHNIINKPRPFIATAYLLYYQINHFFNFI